MFSNTIDSKGTFTDNNGQTMKDLGQSIFESKQIYDGIICNIYRGFEQMNMRPDTLSYGVYGTDDYCEMLLKYNDIENPFSVSKDDTYIVPSVVDVNKNVTLDSVSIENTNSNLVRNYHKYIDKTKLPDTNGSEENTMSIDSNTSTPSLQEPNISDVNSSPITEIGNRLYFGTNSGLCTADGISTTELFNSVIKANL